MVIPVDLSPKRTVQSRAGGNPNVSDQPGNGKGRYIILAQAEEMRDPIEEMREEQFAREREQKREQDERDAQRRDPNAASELAPDIPNRDVPNKTWVSSPESRFSPGIDDFFVYKAEPKVPGDYNENYLVTPENAETPTPRTLRNRAIYFRRLAQTRAAGEPISVATGVYLEDWLDFVIPAAMPFDGRRHMRIGLVAPAADYRSPHGACQISAFDEIISNPERGKLDFHQADGKIVRFDRPQNVFASHNAAYPHLDLRAPWIRQLQLRDRTLIKHFRQYDDRVYRLESLEDLNGHTITFTRNENGWLERADGPTGLSLVFTNDACGHRTRVALIGTDGSELELTRHTYDDHGRMTAADCAFGMSVRYYWHETRDLLLRWHNLTKRSETHFTYDDDGRVLHTRTNGIWNDDRFRYDPQKRETTYLPGGDLKLAQRFAYDANDNVTAETDALGYTITHTFDAVGSETATTDANGHASSAAYDIRGNIKQCSDAEGRSVAYAWGPHGELDTIIDGAGNIRRWGSDERANALSATDAEGNVTLYGRDERGRLLRTTFPDGAAEIREYDAHGRLKEITDARGGVTRYEHDAFGRVVSTTDALGHVTRCEYSAGAGGFSTPTTVSRPDGVRIARSYSPEGTLASITDGEGRRWTHSYGAFDVLQAIEDPKGGRLSFAHDNEGRVTGVTNQKGLTYHLIRDAAGRVIAEEDFDGRRTEYARDPGGRIIETKKPDGVRLAYAYDRTDKLTSIKGFAADDLQCARPLCETHFWYDRRGLLIRASNQAGLVEFERDGNGCIISESTNGRKVESKLDASGSRIERCIGRGQLGEGVVRFANDPLGMVASITIDDHAPLSFERDALGRETRRSSARGFRLDQSWDAAGKLVHQSAGRGPSGIAGLAALPSTPAPGTAAQRRYTWDKAGAPVGIADLIWGETRFRYDQNGQVGEASFGDGFSEGFEYDPAKNLVGVRLQGPELVAGVAGLLDWQATPGGVVQLARGPHGERIALTHDVCGRVIKRRVDRLGFRPKSWRYGWDALDRLAFCVTPEGDTWFYRYDPFGRRLTKVRKLRDQELAWTARTHSAFVSAAAREATIYWTWPQPPPGTRLDETRPPIVGTHFTWDGDLIAEVAPLRLDGTLDWEDVTRWHFEPCSFMPLAKQASSGKLLHISNDHLGTPRELFDEAGNLCSATRYTTWGTVSAMHAPSEPANEAGLALYPRHKEPLTSDPKVTSIDDAHCPLRFQGQWSDEENGFYYNRNRYYDPLSAQYTAVDPIGLHGGAQPQAYVECPCVGIDPLGWSTAPRDALGRITSYNNTVGPKNLGSGSATNQGSRDFARLFGREDDDAGHALGRNLGGSGTDLDNIFPQSIRINRGAFRAFEQQIANRIRSTGQTAKLSLVPSYVGNSFRPTGLTYSATFSDGTTMVQPFANP